jgi:hypothetical protein
MTPQRTRQVIGWIRSAETKVHRCSDEWGYGDVGCLRYSRGRMRRALTLLRKAAYELGSIEHPGPAVRKVHAYAGALALEVEQILLVMDEDIAALQ